MNDPFKMSVFAHRGLTAILIMVVLILTLSIAARLIVRNILRDSRRSRAFKKGMGDLAALLVAGIIGMIALVVIGKMH